MTETATFHRPFPALTPAQRYHLDVHGYVIVPGVLTPDEIEETKAALYQLRDNLLATEQKVLRGAFFMINQPHHYYMGTIARAHPAIAAYASHPKVVGMAEELMGGKGHIVEVNAHINTRAPEWPTGPDGLPRYGFHRGLEVGQGDHYKNGLYHANFVKVLTNLTDLGPDDGGTVVIPGSHKIDADTNSIIEAAYADRSLIHQVVAPAGSALLFTEALIHATGQITSDRERVIIISGYNQTYFPWIIGDGHALPGTELTPEFIENIPEPLRFLFVSHGYIQREPRYRTLAEPMDETPLQKIKWPNETFKT